MKFFVSIIALLCWSDAFLFSGRGTDQARIHSSEMHPSWSPDGKYLTFYSDVDGDYEIYTLEIKTGVRKQLTHSDGSDEKPVWSPTGEYITFYSDRAGNFDIFIIKPDGTGLKQLTSRTERDMSPSWSPDGKSIVYEVDYQGNWQFFIVDIEDGKDRQLTDGKLDHLAAAWSLDGEKIFFSRSFRGKHQTDVEIQVMELQSMERHYLTEKSSVSSNVAISPGSDRIIFNSLRDGDWEIYSMALDGTDQKRLTKSGEKLSNFEFSDIDGQPSLSYDGKKIAFMSGRDGSFDIWVMRVKGKKLKNLTRNYYKEK